MRGGRILQFCLGDRIDQSQTDVLTSLRRLFALDLPPNPAPADSVKSQHKKALALSKVRAFEIYSIRHTFLTRLGDSGCDVWSLARIAGHSQISMSQRYVHPEQDAVMNMD